MGVLVTDPYVYVGDGEFGLQVIDVTIPGAPTIVGGLDARGMAIGLAAAGEHVYMAAFDHGLIIAPALCGAAARVEAGWRAGH
jgi:hypothetical protein